MLSSVRVDSAPGVLLARFEDGHRLIATSSGCYEPDEHVYEKARRTLGPRLATRTIEDSVAIPLTMSLTVAGSLAWQLFALRQDCITCGIASYVVILAFNLLFHEAGHAIALKLFLPEAKVGLGFRFVFVFPTFYVNTTASYLLPKGKRAAVHLAGTFANAVGLGFGNLLVPGAISANVAIAWMMLLNLTPIMKGDGHQILAALLGWRTPALSERRRVAEEFVRGAVMLTFVIVLSELVS